jgi:hypothetical protein
MKKIHIEVIYIYIYIYIYKFIISIMNKHILKYLITRKCVEQTVLHIVEEISAKPSSLIKMSVVIVAVHVYLTRISFTGHIEFESTRLT